MTQRYLSRMLNYKAAALAMLCFTSALPLAASEMAAATYTVTQLSPTTWQYNLTLNDTGTTNVGTFWFSWTPGHDFMPAMPTSVFSPAGWVETITGSNNSSDGNAIQWVANTGSAETPGEILPGFAFDST